MNIFPVAEKSDFSRRKKLSDSRNGEHNVDDVAPSAHGKSRIRWIQWIESVGARMRSKELRTAFISFSRLRYSRISRA